MTASPKIKAIILEKVIIQEFGSIEKAAFELRKYYHSPIGNTKSKLEFLGNHYPDNATVQYHYTLALGATNVNTLYNKWPNEISQCILNDELLTYKDKYKLFNEIKKTNNFPAFSKNVLDLITTQEALEKKENLSIKKLPLYTNSMREIKTINNFTCTFSGISPDLTVTITSDDDFFALQISPEIMKTIYNCNTLSDLSNSLKAEEVKKKNSGFILNDLTHLIDQYASIFSVTSNENATQETVSNAVETKEAFTFTKKSTTTVAKNTYPKDLDVNDSLILAKKYLEQAVKLYDEEPEVSLRILTNFHLSAEQKYQCFMTIMGESDLEKNPLPESVTLFIAEQESKELATITNASHVESSSATQVTLSNTHRINNFVCEFDVATDGILLVIKSDNNDRAYLYVSEDNQKEILSCTDLRSLAQILNSSGIKKLNELSNIPIVNIIEQDADILDACSYSKETTENVPQNATGNPHIFFKASHVAVDSKAENDKNSSTELAQAGLNQ